MTRRVFVPILAAFFLIACSDREPHPQEPSTNSFRMYDVLTRVTVVFDPENKSIGYDDFGWTADVCDQTGNLCILGPLPMAALEHVDQLSRALEVRDWMVEQKQAYGSAMQLILTEPIGTQRWILTYDRPHSLPVSLISQEKQPASDDAWNTTRVLAPFLEN